MGPRNVAIRAIAVGRLGGVQATYHGPGQLVVYPVVGLRALGLGARAYVEGLEDCLIRVAALYGLHARVLPFPPGCCLPMVRW